MVTTFFPADHRESACPACGATIKASGRRRRVQCPKCREIVTLDPPADPKAPPSPPQPATGASESSRIGALEKRVAAIEEALKTSGAPPAAADAIPALRWVCGDAGQSPDASPEQEHALIHNLGAIKGQEITIRSVVGDPVGCRRAEWFKAVFERAGFVVRGPQQIARATEPGMSLAVPSVPVAKKAAETYLALKAAGFEPIPVLDPDLASGAENEPSPLSLTLAPARVA